MAEGQSRLLRFVGWGNILLGGLIPFRTAIQIHTALDVCSFSHDGRSFLFLILLGSLFAIMSARSGWGILKESPWARTFTCWGGGIILGYVGVGNFMMTVFGRNRGLSITIRHWSERWWNWTMSHFQNPVLLEGPLMIWWIFALSVLLRSRGPILPRILTYHPGNWGTVAAAAFFGGLVRLFQVFLDVQLLASQR